MRSVPLVFVFFFLLTGVPQVYSEVTVFAHRGKVSSFCGRENTLEAFEYAWQLGLPVEMDVHLSADGVLIVVHDDRVTELSDGQSDVFVDEVSSEILIGWGAPRLLDVLDRFAVYQDHFTDRVGMMVEVKTPRKGAPYTAKEIGRKVADLLATRQGFQTQILLASFNPFSLSVAKKKNKTLKRCLNTGEFTNEESKTLSPLTKWALKNLLLAKWVLKCLVDPYVVSFEHTLLSSSKINYYHKQGIKVYAWGVTETDRARCLAEWGVDGIITDRPVIIRSELETNDFIKK
ncbi:MAG: glycerophosphodiester phosphodiesterase [Cellvibrionales bacterium]|nr:glycerophosphodiester phosphodiesterase [Cellvibrionales bacterium]